MKRLLMLLGPLSFCWFAGLAGAQTEFEEVFRADYRPASSVSERLREWGGGSFWVLFSGEPLSVLWQNDELIVLRNDQPVELVVSADQEGSLQFESTEATGSLMAGPQNTVILTVDNNRMILEPGDGGYAILVAERTCSCNTGYQNGCTVRLCDTEDPCPGNNLGICMWRTPEPPRDPEPCGNGIGMVIVPTLLWLFWLRFSRRR